VDQKHPRRGLALGLSLLIVASATLACAENGTATGPTPAPAALAEDDHEERTNADTYEEYVDRREKHNIVRVKNTDDGRFLARSSVVLDRVGGKTVDARNEAWAESTCTDCQTVAVALQVVVYKRGAPTVTPLNLAVALNIRCTRCVTVALAFQYVIPVGKDDEEGPTKVPSSVRQLIRELDRELDYFEQFTNVRQIDPAEAERRLVSIIDKHATLKQYLSAMRDEKTIGDTGSPSPSPSPGTGASPSPTATPSATPTGTP